MLSGRTIHFKGAGSYGEDPQESAGSFFCKEGLDKAAIEEFHHFTQLVNKFTLAALINSDSVIGVLRRGFRRLAPDMKVSPEDITALLPDVLKREVVEGDMAQQARRRVRRSSGKSLRQPKKVSDRKGAVIVESAIATE